MTDQSPMHTRQAHEAHAHIEDPASPKVLSSQSMPAASTFSADVPALSDPNVTHASEISPSGIENSGHNVDLNEALNGSAIASPPLADDLGTTSETLQDKNDDATFGRTVPSNPSLAIAGVEDGGTDVVQIGLRSGEVEGREKILETDPLGVVEADITEGIQTCDTTKVAEEDENEDTGSQVLASPIIPGLNNNSQLIRQRNDTVDAGFRRSSPQPWDLVDPPDTNERREFHSAGRPKVQGTSPNKHRPSIPYSSYYFGPPPEGSAYGTPPIGQIGIHHPREILRVERDYTGGELIQFAPVYPLELEGRISPTQFLESINAINELLISAHSLRHSFFDNLLAVVTLQVSKLVFSSHYEKEMRRLGRLIGDLNAEIYNPVGLNILWPRKVAFLFLEIEYY